jgi:class 3 adenylate cyclase
MENDQLTSELKGQRTLATVVFTDCVGFSARMSVNEDHTLDLIRRDLKVMKQLCEQFEGRVLKSTGDGLLMCFVSAVKAVEYAVQIQKTLTERVANLPPDDALQHRIGIHLADIFINETDVMGNGVNIAARLQTLASPGGICISQTVYDVVKAGLQLETRFLGPQELKNIREVVPTYKIVLNPAAEADPYTEIVQKLERNRNSLRIKKLLFYACKNVWESNQDRFTEIDLKSLLQDVLRLAPNPDQLRYLLDAIVKTLSKPEEYSLVARTIVDEVSKLHFNLMQQQRATSVNSSTAPFQKEPSFYGQLAQELERGENPIRARKLLFYVCKKRWENDPNELNQVSLPELLTELHQLAPTHDRLPTLLNEYIQTLSKKAEYSLVANEIIAKLQPLYSTDEVLLSPVPPLSSSSSPPVSPSTLSPLPALPLPSPEPSVYNEIASNLEKEPNLIRIKKLMQYVCRRRWENDPESLTRVETSTLVQELHQLARTPEQLETALYSVVRSLSKAEEYTPIAQAIAARLSRLYTTNVEAAAEVGDKSPEIPEEAPPPDPELSAPVPEPNLELPSNPDEMLPAINLFDSRLGIMKYVNPLRAKILLFTALNGDFAYTTQDWLNLKMVEMDGLLRLLLSTCRAYTDLEDLLFRAAHQLREPEEGIQVATDIIKCLRSFYLHGDPARLLSNPTAGIPIRLDMFEENTREISGASDEEFTCQLFSCPDGSATQLAGGGATEAIAQPMKSVPPPHLTDTSINHESQ